MHYQNILNRFHDDTSRAQAILATAHGVVAFIVHQKMDEQKAKELINQSAMIISHQ